MNNENKKCSYILATLCGASFAGTFICGFILMCISHFGNEAGNYYLNVIGMIVASLICIVTFVMYIVKTIKMNKDGILTKKMVGISIGLFVVAFVVVYCVLGAIFM